MFYTEAVLTKQGPLARIWLAAHWDKKLTKAVVFETNLESACESVINPSVKLALRTSGHLLLGVVRIYNRKARYLLADCNEAFMKIKLAFRSGLTIDLPKDHDNAKNQIFLPDDLDDLTVLPEISQNELQSAMLRNTARIEEITRKNDTRSLQHSGIFRDLLRNNDYEDDDFGLGTNFDDWDDPSDPNMSKSIEKGRRDDSRNRSTSVLEKRATRIDPMEMEVDIMKELNENQDNDLDIFGAGVVEDDPPPPPMEITPIALETTAQGPMVQFEDISKVQSPGGHEHDHIDSPPMDVPSPLGADDMDTDMPMMQPPSVPADLAPPTPGEMHMPPTPMNMHPPTPQYVPVPSPGMQQHVAQSPLMMDPNQMIHQQQMLQQQQMQPGLMQQPIMQDPMHVGLMQEQMQQELMQQQAMMQQQQQQGIMQQHGMIQQPHGLMQQFDAMGQPMPSPVAMAPPSPMVAPSPGMPPSPGMAPSPAGSYMQPQTPGLMAPPTPQEADRTNLGSDNQLVLSPLHPSHQEAPQPHRQPRVRKKRKLLVDGMMEITNSMMKAQLKDYSDIVLPVETNYDWLAPPTIRLVQWKEHGTTEPLFKHNFVGDKNRDKMEHLQSLQYAPGAAVQERAGRNTSRDKTVNATAMATPVSSRKRTASKEAQPPQPEQAPVTPAPPQQENTTMPPPAVTPAAPEKSAEQGSLEMPAPAIPTQETNLQSTPAPGAPPQAPNMEMSSIQQQQDTTMQPPPPPPQVAQQEQEDDRPREKRARFDEENLEQTKIIDPELSATGEKTTPEQQQPPPPPTAEMQQLEMTANQSIIQPDTPAPPTPAPATPAPESVPPPSNQPFSPNAPPEKSLEEAFAHINFRHLDDDKKRHMCMVNLISADMDRQNADDAGFFNISHGQDRKRAARQFYSILVLRKQKIIEVQQNGPCEDFTITKNENWHDAQELLAV